MEESRRKISWGKIRTIIYFFLIVGLIVSLVFLVNDNKKLSKEKKENNSTYDELENEYQELENKKQEDIKELDKLKNIDKVLEESKEKVFKLASEVEKEIKDGKSKSKIAYLTFDDGPYYSTNKFIEVLDKYKVRATFFTIGLDKDPCYDNGSAECGTMYKKLYDKGHTVANHTYNHAIFYGLYSSADSFIKQVSLQEKHIKDKTGYTTNIVRFPGGSASSRGLKDQIVKKLREKNYGWVDWTANDGDGGNLESKEQAWSTFTKTIDEDIEVVLMHDYNHITLSILPDVIEYLEKKDYILLPLFYDSVMINK